MKTSLELFVLLILPGVVYSYRDLRCPSQSEWIFRSSWVCNDTDTRRYICLYNAINLIYEESCKFEPAISGNGSQYVIRVYPNPEDCRNHQRYQPFPLGSNASSDCVFQKSKCSDEGHILFNPGSSEKDITCRCDFEKGYGFVNRTQRKCDCLPSKEDCSCYLKRNQCSPRHRFISDFTCLHEDNRNYINECPGMGPVSPKKDTPPAQQLSENELKSIDPINRLTDINMIAGFVIACILYALCALFCIIINKLPDCCYIDIRPYNLDIQTVGRVMQISWSAPDEVPAIDILSYNLYYVCNGEKKKININGFNYYVLTEILPRETYSFKVSVCLKNSIESKCTKEKPYKTGFPKKPKCARTYGENSSIVLCWEAPSNTLIKIEEYLIHISTDQWKSFDTVLVNELSYTINKVTMYAVYRFKIFACSNSVKSDPESEVFPARPDAFTTLAHFVGNDLKDKESVTTDAVSVLEKACNGNVIKAISSVGSVVVEITFISEEITDEKVLHETLKNAFETRMPGPSIIQLKNFFLKRLNDPSPPQLVKASRFDNGVSVSWENPSSTFFKTKEYIVEYTRDEWKSIEKITVPVEMNSCFITNVLLSANVQVKVYTCNCQDMMSSPSTEVPNPPRSLSTLLQDGNLVLNWKYPEEGLSAADTYKIFYKWKGNEITKVVNATESSQTIPNVCPAETYTFTISSCVKNFTGNPSEELQFYSGVPKKPSSLLAYRLDDSIRLRWTAPERGLFRTEYYYIEVTTCTSWKDKHGFQVPAVPLEHSIMDIISDKTYYFKIYAVSGSVRSEATCQSCLPILPNPPRALITLLETGNLVLKWKYPEEGILQADTYKILCKWKGNEITKVVNATESSQIIPNICPAETYTFTITSCFKNITGNPSEELVFYSGAPHPPRSLSTLLENGNLVLKWKSPEEGLFTADTYKIFYRWKGNIDGITKVVNATESSQIIPNICPAETYTFTITSCVKNITGNPSEELQFYSGVPNKPPSLQANCIDESIRLVWTAPEEDLFRTEYYYIEVATCTNWDDKHGFRVPAVHLEHSIKDIILNKTYYFKIYAVSGNVRSEATCQTYVTSPSWYLGLRMKGKAPKNVFEDKDCKGYHALSEEVTECFNAVCQSLPGEQHIADIDFSEGSIYAALLLLSKGFYDEDALRSTFENIVKTGKFGRFSVSFDRFCFKFLDKPLPPKIIDAKNIDTTVQVSWSQPTKTFFKTQQYLLKISTNKWESFEEHTISGDKCQYSVLDVLPSTTYAFKIYTVVKYSIKSLPSNEMSALTKGPIPPNSIDIRPVINGINGIMISWNKPNNRALSHIKQYHITVQEDENMLIRSTGTKCTSFTMTDVKSSTTYRLYLSTVPTNGIECDHSKMIDYKTKGHTTTITFDMKLMMDSILMLKKNPKTHTKHGFKLLKYDEHGDTVDLQRREFYRKELKNQTCRISKAEFNRCFSTVTDIPINLLSIHGKLKMYDSRRQKLLMTFLYR